MSRGGSRGASPVRRARATVCSACSPPERGQQVWVRDTVRARLHREFETSKGQHRLADRGDSRGVSIGAPTPLFHPFKVPQRGVETSPKCFAEMLAARTRETGAVIRHSPRPETRAHRGHLLAHPRPQGAHLGAVVMHRSGKGCLFPVPLRTPLNRRRGPTAPAVAVVRPRTGRPAPRTRSVAGIAPARCHWRRTTTRVGRGAASRGAGPIPGPRWTPPGPRAAGRRG